MAHLRATGRLERRPRGRGVVEVRCYFERPDGTWTSLLPDACYFSYARMPHFGSGGEQPRIAPDIVAEVLSPGDRPSVTRRKVATFLDTVRTSCWCCNRKRAG